MTAECDDDILEIFAPPVNQSGSHRIIAEFPYMSKSGKVNKIKF
jgi:hypothetical protein